ncbi:MAG: hypothetical protein RR662_07320, partial [Clostridia bacterium]
NNINESNDDYIFDTVDVFCSVNVNEYNNVNIVTNNIDSYIEILSIDINLESKNIKKIKNNTNYIYIINFIYYINIKIYIDQNIQEIKVKQLCSKSIIFKDIDESFLEIHPINFDIENINNHLQFAINFVVVDKSKALNLENTLSQNNNNNNNNKSENIIKKNYSYIDTDVEFS